MRGKTGWNCPCGCTGAWRRVGSSPASRPTRTKPARPSSCGSGGTASRAHPGTLGGLRLPQKRPLSGSPYGKGRRGAGVVYAGGRYAARDHAGNELSHLGRVFCALPPQCRRKRGAGWLKQITKCPGLLSRAFAIRRMPVKIQQNNSRPTAANLAFSPIDRRRAAH